MPQVLAIGAAGRAAGLVVPELVRRGAWVRGLVRRGEQVARVREQGAAEVAVGDLRDRESLSVALRGIDAVFYIAPVFMTDEAAVGEGVVAAAKAAGVRRIVFSAVIHPVLSDLVNHAAKAPVEAAILDSGVEYSFLHPTVFFQNLARAWPGVVRTGVIAEPWSITTRFSRVDYRDVAEVAAIALTEDRLLDGTFELCAEGAHSREDMARMIGEVLGRPIRAERADPDSVPDAPPAMRRMFAHYDHFGLRGNALTLGAILGRAPRSLRAYFEELAA
jgi:uncharacterized protein YbjT (DUF2867 family)